MLKVLLAVESCAKYDKKRAAQRRTWLRHRPDGLDFKYFIGKTDIAVSEPDLVTLWCGDGYNDLIGKTRQVVRWALSAGYDYLFKTDDDTFVDAVKLLASDFAAYEYVGWCKQRDYAQGGSGYWLSRRAMRLLVFDDQPTPETIAEDQHVGIVLRRHGIYPVHDNRLILGPTPRWQGWPTRSDRCDTITMHKLMPMIMDECYRHWLEN